MGYKLEIIKYGEETMTKRNLLKEPFTDEEMKRLILTKEEIDYPNFEKRIEHIPTDTRIFIGAGSYELERINMQNEDGLYYRGCGDEADVETICCKSMYETSTDFDDDHIGNGTCKPACMCDKCEKTYKNLEEWLEIRYGSF